MPANAVSSFFLESAGEVGDCAVRVGDGRMGRLSGCVLEKERERDIGGSAATAKAICIRTFSVTRSPASAAVESYSPVDSG